MKSFEEAPCEVWACNWKTFRLFEAMGSQWRVGMSGPTGLDYGALRVVAQVQRVRLTARRLANLRAMEAEALRVMGERRAS